MALAAALVAAKASLIACFSGLKTFFALTGVVGMETVWIVVGVLGADMITLNTLNTLKTLRLTC